MSLDGVADIVIAEFALSEAELVERLSSLKAEVRCYQELTCALLDGLHDVATDRDRCRTAHRQLLDEFRALREQLILTTGAADEDDAT